MKKIAFALTALTLAAAPAFAGAATTDIKVTGTVLNSCVFVTNQDSTFDYTAANGMTNAVPGSATAYCNGGTIGVAGFNSYGGDLSLSDGQGNTLAAHLQLDPAPIWVRPGTGSYEGSASMTYVYNPTAAAGQWSVPSGTYTGAYTVEIRF